MSTLLDLVQRSLSSFPARRPVRLGPLLRFELALGANAAVQCRAHQKTGPPGMPGVLFLRTSDYYYAPPERRAAIARLCLGNNYRIKLAKFGIDPADGEIVVNVELLTTGRGTLTMGQVTRGIRSLHMAAAMSRAQIGRVLRGGPDRGPDLLAYLAFLGAGQRADGPSRSTDAPIQPDDGMPEFDAGSRPLSSFLDEEIRNEIRRDRS